MKHMAMIMTGAVVLSLAAGCGKKYIGTSGEPLQEEGAPVAVTVTGVEVQRLELEGPKGPLLFDKPALAVRIKFENSGAGEFFYQPTHGTDKTSSLQAPVLFVDPNDPEKEPSSVIPGVYLDGNLVDGQQKSGVQVASGDSVEDVYLFQPPDQEQLNLILQIPPALHGGKTVLSIKIDFQSSAPPAAVITKQGAAAKIGGVEVTLKDTEIVYVEMKDSSKNDKGFSKEPVLKLNYSINNTGKTNATYSPGHNASGNDIVGLALREEKGRGVFLRVRFSADREVIGQMTTDKVLAAGKSVDDFVLFERPPKNYDGKSLMFMFPGKTVGQEGLGRIAFPYAFKDPAKPKALRGN